MQAHWKFMVYFYMLYILTVCRARQRHEIPIVSFHRNNSQHAMAHGFSNSDKKNSFLHTVHVSTPNEHTEATPTVCVRSTCRNVSFIFMHENKIDSVSYLKHSHTFLAGAISGRRSNTTTITMSRSIFDDLIFGISNIIYICHIAWGWFYLNSYKNVYLMKSDFLSSSQIYFPLYHHRKIEQCIHIKWKYKCEPT